MIFGKEKAAGGNHTAEKYEHPHLNNSPTIVQANFKAAMDAAGLSTKDPITPDGKLHRFHVEGDKPGSKNGFYVLYDDGVPAGCFGSWKTGDTIKWCAKPDRELTNAQRQQNRRRMIEAQKAREAEEAERRKTARDKAFLIWTSSPPAPDSHSYLTKKGVKNHGLRLHKGLLVIPMRDGDGNLHSLQFIDGDGNKRFLLGRAQKGLLFRDWEPRRTLLHRGRLWDCQQHF